MTHKRDVGALNFSLFGGIGRHAEFKPLFPGESGFESRSGHHLRN